MMEKPKKVEEATNIIIIFLTKSLTPKMTCLDPYKSYTNLPHVFLCA